MFCITRHMPPPDDFCWISQFAHRCRASRCAIEFCFLQGLGAPTDLPACRVPTTAGSQLTQLPPGESDWPGLARELAAPGRGQISRGQIQLSLHPRDIEGDQEIPADFLGEISPESAVAVLGMLSLGSSKLEGL